VDHLCFQRWNFVSKITGVTVLAPKRYPARNCSSVFQRHLRDSARDTRNDIAAASAQNAALARAVSLHCRIRDIVAARLRATGRAPARLASLVRQLESCSGQVSWQRFSESNIEN
jgi:hypothetical protein